MHNHPLGFPGTPGKPLTFPGYRLKEPPTQKKKKI
jgi:hypothetical protein